MSYENHFQCCCQAQSPVTEAHLAEEVEWSPESHWAKKFQLSHNFLKFYQNFAKIIIEIFIFGLVAGGKYSW